MVEVAYMATIKLGRLEEVDVRKLWSHEQYDFSNWLAKEENGSFQRRQRAGQVDEILKRLVAELRK